MAIFGRPLSFGLYRRFFLAGISFFARVLRRYAADWFRMPAIFAAQ